MLIIITSKISLNKKQNAELKQMFLIKIEYTNKDDIHITNHIRSEIHNLIFGIY
jgi:hypothetical protein